MKRTLLFILIFSGINLWSQEKDKKIKIYYDCQTNCYETFIKQELKGVEFVRDPNFSDVHIQITSETNGSGGETYHLNFMGHGAYKDYQNQYSFATNNDMTSDQIRVKVLKYLKLGLLKYWIKNDMTDWFDISFNNNEPEKAKKDPWNNWIYKIGISGWFNGSSNYSNQNLNGYISAKQVKEAHKFYFKLRYGTAESKYKFGTDEIVSEKEWLTTNVSEVLSINEHWSYGFFSGYKRSKYANLEHSFSLYSGIEYDIFPYKDNAKKSWVFSVQLGGLFNNYFEKTIYNKNEEWLWRVKASVSNSFVLKWGNVFASIDYNSYLHNTKLNSFGIGGGAQIRIAKGLNFNVYGNYSINHDQINIAAGDLSLEETLLQQKQLQSGYDYYFSVGLNYSFGSIYNTIVNPRFASEGGGSTCICF